MWPRRMASRERAIDIEIKDGPVLQSIEVEQWLDRRKTCSKQSLTLPLIVIDTRVTIIIILCTNGRYYDYRVSRTCLCGRQNLADWRKTWLNWNFNRTKHWRTWIRNLNSDVLLLQWFELFDWTKKDFHTKGTIFEGPLYFLLQLQKRSAASYGVRDVSNYLTDTSSLIYWYVVGNMQIGDMKIITSSFYCFGIPDIAHLFACCTADLQLQ